MTKKKVVCGLLSIAFCLGAIGGGVALHAWAESASATNNVNLEATYSKGETVTLPMKTITVDGIEYATSAKVYYPDGSNSVAKDNKIVLSNAGEYRVVYYAIVNGKYHQVEESFSVLESAFGASGKKSSVFYGHHDEYAINKNGVVAQIAQKESFYYNKIIDLKKLNGEAVVSLFVTPSTLGTEDAKVLKLKFTDIYDTNNYVTVEIKRVNYVGEWAENSVYVTANANGQDKVGLEPSSSSSAPIVNGGAYSIHTNSEYGSPIKYSLCGYLYENENIGDREYSLYWDYASGVLTSKVASTNASSMITDLDNPTCYKNPWAGFTTGAVFLSVSAENYNSSTLDVVFTKIGNYDLSEQEFSVETAPVVTVDYAGYASDNLPNAIVGMEYSVYNASAWDFYNQNVEVTTKVYYGYHTNNSYRIDVQDGKFIPEKAGLYTIVYTAKNSYGKTTEYTVDVNAIQTEETLTVEMVGVNGQGVAGREIKVAEGYEVVNSIGNYDVEIVAMLKSNPDVQYVIDKDTLTFTPYYAGEYEIKITATDYLQRVSSVENLSVTANSEPFIDAKIHLPSVLIQGNTYKFPTEIYGYDISSGEPKEIRCQAFVVEDANSEQALAENGVYTVGACTNLTLKYTFTSNGKTAVLPLELPVIKVHNENNGIDIAKYFTATEGGSVSADSDYVHLSAAQDAVFEFVNPLRGDGLETTFALQEINFDAVDMYLSSVKNPAQSIKLTMKNEGTIKIYVNDVWQTQFIGKFSDYTKNSMMVVYNGKTVSFGENVVTIEKYENGEEFLGFDGEISFKIGISGVKGNSKVSLVKLNNQRLYDISEDGDNFKPERVIEMMVGERVLGDELTIKPALAYDVLTGYTDITMQIETPSGDYVKALDGTVLNGAQSSENYYTFKLQEYGQYIVSYQATDGNGNKLKYSYTISCADATLPTVSLSAYSMTVKVGKITIPQISVSDDLTATENLVIFKSLLLPDGRMVVISKDSFAANAAGKYIVYYSVFDETGNMTQAQCVITVTI